MLRQIEGLRAQTLPDPFLPPPASPKSPSTPSASAHPEDAYAHGATVAEPGGCDDLVRFATNAAANAARGRAHVPAPGAGRDDILYLGLNSTSSAGEHAGLHAAHVVDVNVVAAARATTVTGGDVDRLGLPPHVAAGVKKVLDGASSASEKALLLGIARSWAPAYEGHAIPGRLVVSGHHVGDEFFGTVGTREVTFKPEALRALAKAMPLAAAHVEDLHFSGCATGADVTRAEERSAWMAAFPKLQTAWGYAGTAGLAPARDLAEWEHATRGDAAKLALSNTARAGNAVAWSKDGGVVDSLAQLTTAQRVDSANRDFLAYFYGDMPVHDPHEASVNATADTLNALSGRKDIPKDVAANAGDMSKRFTFVRFYEGGVRRNFAATHGAEVRAAYQALGLGPPDFAKLGRREALAAIDRFEPAASHSTRPEVQRGLAILRDLRDLKSLPGSWCTP